jgi:hypothetical protein
LKFDKKAQKCAKKDRKSVFFNKIWKIPSGLNLEKFVYVRIESRNSFHAWFFSKKDKNPTFWLKGTKASERIQRFGVGSNLSFTTKTMPKIPFMGNNLD